MTQKYDDYSNICWKCGMTMQYRSVGMCFECEQIDNDVPDLTIPDYSSNEFCPMCGSELYVKHWTSGECDISAQYCTNDNCQWGSVELIDC